MSHQSFRSPGALRALLLALSLVALGGCAAPPADHFYTLSGGVEPAPAPAGAAAAPANLYIEMLAVSVPPQVARNQLVVSNGEGRADLLEQQRWAGPLAAEIGQALSLGVTGELGAIDVFRTPHAADLPVYRISTNVQRFESALGQYALVDAVWSVRKLDSGALLTCRNVISEKVGPGYEALVAGHRRALVRLSSAMSKAVRGLAADGKGGC